MSVPTAKFPTPPNTPKQSLISSALSMEPNASMHAQARTPPVNRPAVQTTRVVLSLPPESIRRRLAPVLCPPNQPENPPLPQQMVAQAASTRDLEAARRQPHRVEAGAGAGAEAETPTAPKPWRLASAAPMVLPLFSLVYALGL